MIGSLAIFAIANIYIYILSRGHSHIEASHSFRQINENQWVDQAL